ncbi:DNA-directed primase/polymerase protein-like isoform X3 [Montipora capricornis]|uniref:DNA-directed primase/polymerase protein-like isoform X3 n=1 Tax=Montipora capricornis TaxID=246305 RepID=UPI0035F1A69E
MANSDSKVKAFYGSASKRIDDPVPVFKAFLRQQMAFDYANACHEDVYVFAKEKDLHGKRKFIVSTLPHFWYQYIRECSLEDRNYYEVIPEGAACRLYFDLEFKREFNPEKHGAKMVDIFIKYVCYQLKDMYNLTCNRESIVDLDSSTSSKFSRHLIFHLPGAVFKDNINVGNFVRHILALLKTKLGSQWIDNQPAISQSCKSYQYVHDLIPEDNPDQKRSEETQDLVPPDSQDLSLDVSKDVKSYKGKEEGVNLEELRELTINDGKGGFSTFCDQGTVGVYTKNRNFRIYRSTKIGKNSHLLKSDQNMFKPSAKGRKGSFSKDPDYLMFLDSLVSNVSMHVGGKDVKVLTCESCEKSSKTPIKGEAQDLSTQIPSQSGFEHSPYHIIDLFVSSVINKGDVQGVIRRWVFFPQGKLLTYDILKNQWCENIKRPHKSNHIMIVVDLKRGVYYQKCHDPDCKSIDYRSPERPIPEDINPLKSAQSVEPLFELDDDDEDLCKAAAEFEEGGTGNVYLLDGASSSEHQESSDANNGFNKTLGDSGRKRRFMRDNFGSDDEDADEALVEIGALQTCQSTDLRRICEKGKVEGNWTNDKETCLNARDMVINEHAFMCSTGVEPVTEIDVPQASCQYKRFGKKCYETADAERTNDIETCLNAEDICTQQRGRNTDNIISAMQFGEVDALSDDNAEPLDKVNYVSDEDANVWIDEDPVSDLELSFAAEEIEKRL